MSFCGTISIVLFVFIALLERTSSKHKTALRSDVPKKATVERSYADLLSSLIKVNEERVTALKKLYLLNSVTYGPKDALRSTIENRLNDYDKMEERLIKSVKYILNNHKHTHKTSKAIDQNDLNENLQDIDYLFVIPIENESNNEQEDDIVNQEKNPSRKALRTVDSDDDNTVEKDSDNESKDNSKSASVEKQNEEVLNEVKGNDTQGRSYYYSYGCGRGRLRCIKACKEAYRDACSEYYCRGSLRDSLRSACKSECISWFY